MFQIFREVRDAKSIMLGGHVRPDGDCVGSVLAMYQYLQKKLPEADIQVFLEQPPEVFAGIRGYSEIRTEFDPGKRFEVCIVMDCAEDRMGAFQPFFTTAGKTINIDHHISNHGCGTVNYVDPAASSTSELVYDMIEKESMDVEIAKAIYIGIIHDTGVFQYSNTTPKTLEIAARLISFGFDFAEIIDKTFYEKTYVQNQILGRALLESILFMDGRCIVSAVDKKIMKFYHVEPKDLDGIVSQLRVTSGVECAIFMYQTQMQEFKVSIRSNGAVDVARVASYFGGGGHVRAAGCTMNGNFYDVVNNLSGQIERQLKETDRRAGLE